MQFLFLLINKYFLPNLFAIHFFFILIYVLIFSRSKNVISLPFGMPIGVNQVNIGVYQKKGLRGLNSGIWAKF